MKNSGLQSDYNLILPIKSGQITFLSEIQYYQKQLRAQFSIIASKTFASKNPLEKQNLEQKAMLELAMTKNPDVVITFDAKAKLISSEDWARMLAHYESNGGKKIIFLVGAAYGLSSDILNFANASVSFGRVTYPHQFMPLLIAEQLYRADTILRGHPYHLAHTLQRLKS